MANNVRNLTGSDTANVIANPSPQRVRLPIRPPAREKIGKSIRSVHQDTNSIPMSLRKLRTGSARRKIVELRNSPNRVGRTITRTRIWRDEPSPSPECGNPRRTARPVKVMKAETISGVAGKPILLMKLKASIIPDTPPERSGVEVMGLGATQGGQDSGYLAGSLSFQNGACYYCRCAGTGQVLSLFGCPYSPADD